MADSIVVFHGFDKKTQKTPTHEIAVWRQRLPVRTAEELGRALRLSTAETAEMEFRSELTVSLVKIIQAGRLTHAEIAKRVGTSRTRVTAIANGNIGGVSTDVLIRVLAAIGYRAEVRLKKAAA